NARNGERAVAEAFRNTLSRASVTARFCNSKGFSSALAGQAASVSRVACGIARYCRQFEGITRNMAKMARRAILKTVVPAITAAGVLPSGTLDSLARVAGKPRIRQSASRWCYQKIPLEELCAKGREMGLEGIDLLNEEEWEIPRQYGLVCSMGYGGG